MEINRSEAPSTLEPFFVTANRGLAPAELTPDVIRSAFGGTVYPSATIAVEPLREGGRGWENFAICDYESEAWQYSAGAMQAMPPAMREQVKELYESNQRRRQSCVERWRALLAWFQSQEDLHGGAFVMVGEKRLSRQNFGRVFPRLVLGLTRSGSLVGVCGYAVNYDW
jgi:hypothetical protein